MYARLKQDYFLDSTTACGGREFRKNFVTEVPPNEEASALANPALETFDTYQEPTSVSVETVDQPAQEDAAPELDNVRAPTAAELRASKRSAK